MAENGDQSGKRRRGPGRRFLPGHSGNPGGRPKGLAAMVRAKTKDGRELVETMLQIARGTLTITKHSIMTGAEYEDEPSHKDRREAIVWLADRGFGRAPEKVELTGADGAPLQPQAAPGILSGVSPDELAEIEAILARRRDP